MKYETAERLVNALERTTYPFFTLRNNMLDTMRDAGKMYLGIQSKQEKNNFNAWYRQYLNPVNRFLCGVPVIGTTLAALTDFKFSSYYILAENNANIPDVNNYSARQLRQLSILASDGYDINKVLNSELSREDIAHSRAFMYNDDFQPTHEYIQKARREMFMKRIMDRFNVEPRSNNTGDNSNKTSQKDENRRHNRSGHEYELINERGAIQKEAVRACREQNKAVNINSRGNYDPTFYNKYGFNPAFSNDAKVEFAKRGHANISFSFEVLESIKNKGEYDYTFLWTNMEILNKNMNSLKDVLINEYGPDALSQNGIDNILNGISEEAKNIANFIAHNPEKVASRFPKIKDRLEKMDKFLSSAEKNIFKLKEYTQEKEVPKKQSFNNLIKSAENKRNESNMFNNRVAENNVLKGDKKIIDEIVR